MLQLGKSSAGVEPGTVVDDRFFVRDLAGEGGMGSVYRAEDLETSRVVAIKVMIGDGTADVTRFFREAQVLSDLSHPAIVGCLGHGSLPSGQPWMAMEWIDGEELTTRLERGPLVPREALMIARTVAGALAAAHEIGIVHRDVKPGNILLEGGDPGRARLIDFGVARIQNEDTSTMTGSLVGTPAYMAPEQIRGASDVDGRADLYSLGVILFECVTGRRPFVAADHVIGVLTQALFEQPPHVRDIDPSLSPALDALVDSLLEKDPAVRLGPATALVEALRSPELERIFSQLPPRMQPTGLTEDELRFVSVVLVACNKTRPASMNSDTVLDRTDGSILHAIERIAAPFHGRVEGLRDGTVLVAFPERGVATDQAAMAARVALSILALGTGVPIALATGRASEKVGSLYSDAAVRASALANGSFVRESAVVIDETTRALLDTRFSIEQVENISFLITEDPFGEGGRLLCGRPAPFVGREREVAFIEKIFDEVVNEPEASAIIVLGEAGAGKSRLSREVLAALSRIEPDTEIWVARGEAVRAGGAFGMLASAVQRAAQMREGEKVEVRHQKLIAFVNERTDANRAASIITFLSVIAETSTESEMESPELRAARRDPMLMGDRIRLAFEDFVESITEKRPLVLLLEDLHWGDLPTVKVLDGALRRLHSKPFFIMALGRPETMQLFPNLFADRSPHTIRLSGLSRRASINFIRRVLGDGVSSDAMASIVERSAGHPLFLEELVRTVAEVSANGTSSLPETVLAMVQARVAKIPADARRALRAASVFGEVFWDGGIARLLGSMELVDQLESCLQLLTEREVIELKRESRFPSEREYAFRHALFREAAYAMLTDEDKATGHLLAGTFLQERGESNAALLAAHMDRAGEPNLAAPHHVRAAREALLGGDWDTVVRHADQASRDGVDHAVAGEALTLKAEAIQWRGGFEQSAQVAELALAKLEPGHPLWFSAMTTLAIASVRRVQLAKLREVCDLLFAWGSQNQWTDAYIEAGIRIGIQAYIGGQYQSALKLLTPLTELVPTPQQTEPRIRALFTILAGARASMAWQYDKALEATLEAGRIFEEMGDLRSAAGQRIDAAFTIVDLGQAPRSIVLCREILEVADRLSLTRLHSITKLMLGSSLLADGQLTKALEVLLDARKTLDELRDIRNGGSVRYKIGRCYRLLGKFDQAEPFFDEAEQMLSSMPRLRAISHANRAFLYVDMNRGAEALQHAEAAMMLFRELSRMGTDEIVVRCAYVQSLLQVGRLEDAATELAIAKERLNWMADKLADEQTKTIFKTNVEENRRVLEMEIPLNRT